MYDKRICLYGSVEVSIPIDQDYRGPIRVLTYGAGGGIRHEEYMKSDKAREIGLALIEAAGISDMYSEAYSEPVTA